MSLEDYGWDETWAEKLAQAEDNRGIPARVISAHRSEYKVHTGETDISAKAAGRLYHAPFRQTELPAVGDWVVVDDTDVSGKAIIRGVLPRKSTFSRKVAGKNSNEQVMATNLDTVWIVSTFGTDLNPARLERYVALVVESGARPVIILAKADLEELTEPIIESIQERIPNVPIYAVSAKAQTGLNNLSQYIAPGQTIALLGSSGVGKSTLINHFVGHELLHTAKVREKDGKGRHTTTHRELIFLPTGGLLLDTPGMRELQLWQQDDNLDKSFSDIDDIAVECRFSDCSHETEPGCAVIASVESGDLSEERFNNYRKLKKELTYLERKVDAGAERAEKERWRAVSKEQRRYSQEHKGKKQR
ncbi:MAG: ribosome small subunit-dependent GTPase A [FCB group bacterium]|nr:ribosome small subunit-dependent GTPase A [FCB group bacterium]MBL7027702.1 ribosome small subunit-dependent GTPase A [Candidatus Neomarinimicrobiota bacterium]MBL7121051.1 ribosome small subunit-dependent GTPase A [Candidatus Neomarinimicrobiota bacterium]